MVQNDERNPAIDNSINSRASISELPGRPFKITMEFPLFITMVNIALSGLVTTNILLYRICAITLDHSKEECRAFLAPDKSNTSKTLEDDVQKYATYVSIVKTLIESLGPAILSLFLGVWSDTYGRKPLVVWPLFGASMSSILIVIYAMLDNYGPWWFILTAVPFSLCGGYTALFTGAFTYISDITTSANRSFRMTILEAAFSAGNFIGSLSSSYLIALMGNTYVLLIIASLNVSAYVFTNIFVTESLNGALEGGLSTLLDFLLVKEMLDTCFKRRPNKGRAQLLLLILSNSLIVFILYGVAGLLYKYTREKLHWAVREYSVYSASGTLIHVLGAVVCVKVGGKFLGINDMPLAVLGYISAFAEFICIALAVKSWHMYMGTGIGVFKGLSAPLIRSHISKTLPLEDIAKAFALLCAFEAICPLLSPVLYNSLYRYTISTFPGAIFILSAGILGVCIVMLGMVQYYGLRSTQGSYDRISNVEES